eukprot:gnl/Spiro4/13607_TR7251_c0_g2_i1.p1 gnl/Spiro4/13607_TR7251_c0_g2~~gnl/Spiro4/13607_TR7251_c0_g2_i1.p1  ORF type:complete len:349 (-),score=89.93 gnl/Spiro4/13607_TR7251_c0_g2_i1:142-1188(-)
MSLSSTQPPPTAHEAHALAANTALSKPQNFKENKLMSEQFEQPPPPKPNHKRRDSYWANKQKKLQLESSLPNFNVTWQNPYRTGAAHWHAAERNRMHRTCHSIADVVSQKEKRESNSRASLLNQTVFVQNLADLRRQIDAATEENVRVRSRLRIAMSERDSFTHELELLKKTRKAQKTVAKPQCSFRCKAVGGCGCKPGSAYHCSQWLQDDDHSACRDCPTRLVGGTMLGECVGVIPLPNRSLLEERVSTTELKQELLRQQKKYLEGSNQITMLEASMKENEHLREEIKRLQASLCEMRDSLETLKDLSVEHKNRLQSLLQTEQEFNIMQAKAGIHVDPIKSLPMTKA